MEDVAQRADGAVETTGTPHSWIELVDRHPEGAGMLAFCAIAGLVVIMVAFASAWSDRGRARG